MFILGLQMPFSDAVDELEIRPLCDGDEEYNDLARGITPMSLLIQHVNNGTLYEFLTQLDYLSFAWRCRREYRNENNIPEYLEPTTEPGWEKEDQYVNEKFKTWVSRSFPEYTKDLLAYLVNDEEILVVGLELKSLDDYDTILDRCESYMCKKDFPLNIGEDLTYGIYKTDD